MIISGPAESLFKESYYQLMKAALRSGGIVCSQGEFIVHWSCTHADKNGGIKTPCFFFCSCYCVTFTGECQWLHLELIKEMQTFCKTLFPVVDYAYSTIPTYPSGQIGFMLCSKNPVSVELSFSACHPPHPWVFLECRFICFVFFQRGGGLFYSIVTSLLCLLSAFFRKQISRNQWKRCQKRRWRVWTLNITTPKFTKHHSSSPSLQER